MPLAMDACGSYMVAASAPLEVCVWRVDLAAAPGPGGAVSAAAVVVRELSILSVGQPLQARPRAGHTNRVLRLRLVVAL